MEREKIEGDGNVPDRDNPVGTVVVSISGHDRGRVYLVVASDESFLYLADGDKRPFARPKKKRRRHTTVLGRTGNSGERIDRIRTIRIEADQSALIRKELTGFAASHGNP